MDNGQDYAQIVAPSSLEEGYQLEALVNGQVRTIVVVSNNCWMEDRSLD